MLRNEKLEIKVGLFIGVGIFLMFFLVFSIGDLYFFEEGKKISVTFDFVNGITPSSPVRYAGVQVGEVRSVDLFRDRERGHTRVRVKAWVRKDADISEDAICRISSLGLLGEQYLEITPGLSAKTVPSGGELEGRNPVNVGEQMERMRDLAESFSEVMTAVERGEGTLGRFLFDDGIYTKVEDLVDEIRRNPWRLLHRPSARERRQEEEPSRGTEISPKR